MQIDEGLYELIQLANKTTEEENICVEKKPTLVKNQKRAGQHEAIIVQKRSMEASYEVATSARYTRGRMTRIWTVSQVYAFRI